MANCVMCGSPVPEGQRTCSMCYGDMGHGRDGYYREWSERREREREEERAADRERADGDTDG